MVKKWKKMSGFERLNYIKSNLFWCCICLFAASMYSFANHWAALPMAVWFAIQMEGRKTRKILLDELGGKK